MFHPLVMLHILFKVCRPLRRKYRLSVNCLITLNAAYLYSRDKGNSFTRRKLADFITYYNRVKINKYFTVLVGKGCLSECGSFGRFPLYCITSKGIEVIEGLRMSYDEQIDVYSLKVVR